MSRLTFVLSLLVALQVGNSGSLHAGLLVVSRGSGEVHQFDQTSGAPLGAFASGGGLVGGEDLVFGPDGDLYVSDFTNTGTAAVRYNGQTGVVVRSFSWNAGRALGLAFGPDGNLYVASSQLLRYDVTTGALTGTFDLSIGPPDDIVFGPDGNLYVAAPAIDQVVRFDGTTFASLGVFTIDGGLNEPTGLTFGPDGNLYVSSWGDSRILRYDGVTGVFIDTFASTNDPAYPYAVFRPNGLAFGPDGNLYAAVDLNINRYDGATGAFIDVFAEDPGPEYYGPNSIVFSPTQTVPEPSTLLISSVLFGVLGVIRSYKRLKQTAIAN